MNSPTEPDYKALLIEALARLEALDMLPGDPGGPFYCRDADDLAMAMRWISAVRTDPPSWSDHSELDPLSAVQDLEMTREVDERALLLLDRMRKELFHYYERVAKVSPERAAKWRPWWRTRR
jgi:hypothetical protein